MAPIFVQEDIEALIRHFPPLSLEKGRPSLVRTSSGNGLTDFESALSQFESALEQGESRIDTSNIHSLLGVEKDAEQRILDQCSLQLYYSKDGRFLIPVPLADSILQDLTDLARTSFVDLGSFARDQDIALGSIDRWIKLDGGAKWQTFSIDDKKFLCNQSLRGKIETRIRETIGAAGPDVCNISSSFEDEVQNPILQLLVESITEGQGGDVILDGSQVIYVPDEYSTAAEERYRQSQLDRAHLMATELEDNRFSVIQLRAPSADAAPNGASLDIDELEQTVRAKFEEWHPEGIQMRSLALRPESGSQGRKAANESQVRLLVDAGILEHELGRLKAAAIALVEDDWPTDGDHSSSTTIFQKLGGTAASSRPELTRLLLRSECVAELEDTVSGRIDDLQQQDHDKLEQLLEARLLSPFQLYAVGISTIVDPTLRQHLEEFVFDHFRREVIPQMVKSAADQKLLREKATNREIEKLRQATTDAKMFSTLQSSITKFTRKMKIANASKDAVNTVRVRTLQQSVKSMRQMTRGSDVLQNCIWVLLAQRSGGLYMSSGKDTSRMIKQYEAVGDAEMASRLSEWRNLLKAGQDGMEDLQMMRDVAKLAVEEMAAVEL